MTEEQMKQMKMKKISGVISLVIALALLASCGEPLPPTVSGKLEQTWQTGFASGYKASIIDGMLLVPSERDLIAVRISDGRVLWKYESPREKNWNCISVDSFNEGLLACFDSTAGSLLVILDTNGREVSQSHTDRISSQPAVCGPRYWQVQSNLLFGNVRQINLEPSQPMVCCNNARVFVVSDSNVVRAYDSMSTIHWYEEIKALVQNIKLIGELLIVQTTDEIVVFNEKDGKFLWAMRTLASVLPQPFGKNLIMASDKAILELDAKGTLVRSIQKESVLSIAVADDGFAIISQGKIETYGNDFKQIQSVDDVDGTHQVLVFNGMIITSGTTGQVAYRIQK
jgi:outer membrane protein assembly factor BamB